MSGQLSEFLQLLHAATGGKVDAADLPLKVHGDRLVYEPKNITMEEALEVYKLGRPVFIRLEPGDATRYDLLITPLQLGAPNGLLPSYGVKPHEWVFVSQVNLSKQTTFMKLGSRWDINWYLDEIVDMNDFTKLAMCWFVGYLSLRLGH